MTIQASGAISLRDVNFELKTANASISNTTTISMNDTRVRALTGNTTNASIEKFSYFYGKSAATVRVPLTYSVADSGKVGGTATVDLYLYNNGVGKVFTNSTGLVVANNWYIPTTSNIGNVYWAQANATNVSTFGNATYTANTGWVSLSANTFHLGVFVDSSVGLTGQTPYVSVDYQIKISTSSSGTPVVASNTITLSADVTVP